MVDRPALRARLVRGGRPADPAPADNALQARLAALPPDTRPAPSVAAYDQLLQHPAPAPPAARIGHAWDDGDVCLWRDEGRWGLTGPDGDIEVAGFGLFGNSLRPGDTKGAQAAAADALTGRGRHRLGPRRMEPLGARALLLVRLPRTRLTTVREHRARGRGRSRPGAGTGGPEDGAGLCPITRHLHEHHR